MIQSIDTQAISRAPLVWLLAACLFSIVPQLAVSEDAQLSKHPAEESEILFVRRVETVLREKCLGCHGADPDAIEGSLDVRSLEGLLAGGDSEEPAIVPGEPTESAIYAAATRDSDVWSAMPPKEAEQLSEEELQWLRDWIQTGAVWPSAERTKEISAAYEEDWSVEDGIRVKTSGGLDEHWTNRKYDPAGLWAYQPVSTPSIDANRNPIDGLVEDALPDGLNVAGRADRRTLIRRATFDLLGLPPSPEEVRAFVEDPQNDKQAFAKVIDRLLVSPHYGERMAQHWLDVVRYADSSGFANDFERGNAWRYRDYVVRSFNNDKPYDQFIREQIAGDEMDAENPEMIVATGFLRMGPWELTGMEVPKVARQRFLDDVTNSVGETFLAHSLQCARCHDHKFDPVPTQDYYSIQAVFATTQLAERHAEFLKDENKSGFDEKAYLEKIKKNHQRTLNELNEIELANGQQWFKDEGKSPAKWNAAIAKLKKNGKNVSFGNLRNQMRKEGVAESDYPPKHVGFTPEQFGRERVARKGVQRLSWEFDRYQPYALAVFNGRTKLPSGIYAPVRVPKNRLTDGQLEETAILTGGDPFSPSQKVSPGILSVISDQVSADLPDSMEGRRLAFAEWVASADNPLTKRTIANRIWLWHFGQAIAGNPNNFGSTGKPPTHPKLLDWLASTFVENNWSFKSLHRQIMMSDAYCRAGSHPNPAELTKLDPAGTSYAVFQPRRLTAEEIRDAMLAATQELNPKVGGIPCRPVINQEVALQPRQVMGTFAAAWTPNPLPQQRNRRSLYVLKLRGLVEPMLEVFNAPSPDFSCERRQASTVTPQVFALFNSESAHTRALTLAASAVENTKSDQEAIRFCFERTLSRKPTSKELEMALAHWKGTENNLPKQAPQRPLPPLEVTRNAVEENTGERFSFVETLYANTDFVPDLRPTDVDRHTRALSDLCLVLMNSNEFVYVY